MYVTKACLECKLTLPLGVTADPTLGLIPSIHLQRHCQSVRAGTQSRKGEGEESCLVIGKDGRGRTDEKEEERKKEEGTDVKTGEYKGEECLSEVSPGSELCSCIFRLTIVWIRVDICQRESSEKDFVKKGGGGSLLSQCRREGSICISMCCSVFVSSSCPCHHYLVG